MKVNWLDFGTTGFGSSIPNDPVQDYAGLNDNGWMASI